MKSPKIESAMREIAKVRDEIKVQLHLAAMDVRGTWTKLEPRVAQVEARIVELGDAAAGEMAGQVEKLRRQLVALRAKIVAPHDPPPPPVVH